MKPSHLPLFTLATLSLFPSLDAAPLLPGKKIGVDFGPTLTANWNNFTGNGTKADGSVIHLDGSVSDGLVMTVANGQFFNNDGTNNWVGLQSNATDISPNPKAPPEFVDSVTTDIAGNFNLGDATPFQLTVTGLNPWLAYKIDAVSAATGGPIDTLTVVGLATYGPSAIVRTSAVSSGLFHHFDGVVASASGQLVFGVVDSGPGTNPIMSGILLEVTGPTAAGLADNDGDTMPNWWEAAYQLDPASNADGVTDADGDGFSNIAEFNAGSDPRNALSTPAPTPGWAVNGNGNWGNAANWNPSGVPNGVNKPARLLSSALSSAPDATIALDVPVTLGSLEMTSDKPFILGAGNAFTFKASVVNAALSTGSSNGSGLTFLGNVVLASPLTVSTGGQSKVEIAGALSDGGAMRAITKTGSGDLILSGSSAGFAGEFDVQGGRLVLARSGDVSFPSLVSGAGALVHAGGGKLSLTNSNSHEGGTVVINGSTLELDNESPLGFGGITLDGGTLRTTADVLATNRSLNVGEAGATVDVTDEAILLTTGSSAAGTGTLLKTGPGSWRIQGGAAGTIGTFTVAAGFVDFASNDRYGNHVNSQQDLVIGAGAMVTNGSGAIGFNTFRNLSLSGGTLSVTNSLSALTGTFQAYHIKGSIVVEGSTPSFITDEVNGTNGAINIGGTTDLGGGSGTDLLVDVADVSGNAAPDLTISAKLKNSANASFATLATGIVKNGPGTLVLTRINSYTGNTTVEAGTLVLQQVSLADAADVSVATDAVLRLEFSGTDVIDQLTLGGAGMAPGTYGAVGSAAPVIGTPFINGTGTLTVSTGSGTSPFGDWMTTNFPSLGAPDNTAGADPDGDGLTNIMEFAFSGDPTRGSNQGSRRVAIDGVAGTKHLTLTFACRESATFTTGSPSQATADGVDYTVRGSTDLNGFALGIEQIAPITTGLPTAAAGYTYRTFRVLGPVSANSKAFLQVQAAGQVP